MVGQSCSIPIILETLHKFTEPGETPKLIPIFSPHTHNPPSILGSLLGHIFSNIVERPDGLLVRACRTYT